MTLSLTLRVWCVLCTHLLLRSYFSFFHKFPILNPMRFTEVRCACRLAAQLAAEPVDPKRRSCVCDGRRNRGRRQSGRSRLCCPYTRSFVRRRVVRSRWGYTRGSAHVFTTRDSADCRRCRCNRRWNTRCFWSCSWCTGRCIWCTGRCSWCRDCCNRWHCGRRRACVSKTSGPQSAALAGPP